MSLVRLNIKGISYSQTHSGAYALILSEEDSDRKLPIIIGGFEAQSIAIALEQNIQPPRPLTHDLFVTFFENFNVHLKEVLIHKLVDGVFYSSLVCLKDGEKQVIDARTSDAVALAIRCHAPIFTYTNILDQAGIYLEGEKADETAVAQESSEEEELVTTPESSSAKGEYAAMSNRELEEVLKEAVANEDYEKAARIRDEIDKRKNL